tara:strand:- start:180 stop:455 length:276 start_codon:yes stop_codon:yes gene_type:complete
MATITQFTLQDGESAPFSIDGGSEVILAGLGRGVITIAVEGTLGSGFPLMCNDGSIPQCQIHINQGEGERYVVQNNTGDEVIFSVWVIKHG